MPNDPTLALVEAAVARASDALRQIEKLAPELTAEEAAEVVQWIGLRPGPAHRLAAAVYALGNQLGTELGDQPEVWEPVLDAGARFAAAGYRAAAPVAYAADGLVDVAARHHAATSNSPAIRAAGPGPQIQAAPTAVTPHSRIVEPPHR
ncbi:hypothetical protein ABZX85_39545 [Streptomyces sp. NPDC004539]|uniref:hypothetical protein n=1 Tax=Streptomyces sp. NPDC004539 TaxID=3154280 RepID=UPI0033A1E96D